MARGIFGDRNEDGTRPTSIKSQEYFNHNPDIKYAGDVADERAQKSSTGWNPFKKKEPKYKVESELAERPIDNSVPGVDVEVISVSPTGKEKSWSPEERKLEGQILKHKPTQSVADALRGDYGPVDSKASTAQSAKSKKTSVYVKGDQGVYDQKKFEAELIRKSESGEEGSIRTLDIYNRKGELKKHKEASSSENPGKYNRIKRQSNRKIHRANKNRLYQKAAAADTEKQEEMDRAERMSRVEDLGPKVKAKNPRFL